MSNNWINEARNFDDQYKESTPLKSIPFFGEYVRKDLELRQSIVLETLGDLAGKTILDLGCGVGRFSHILAKKGANIIGFDISPEAIKLAKEYSIAEGISDLCEFHVKDLSDMVSFPKADCWIGIGLWQYLANAPDILNKLNSYEKFVTDVPRRYHWMTPSRKIYRTVLKGIKFQTYTSKMCKALFLDAGFKKIDINYSNPTIYIISN